jgi:hypothetical protein
MSAFRPLPPKPSLEFEHKEAKALLRRLRAGDPETLARARAHHPAMDASVPTHIRLADAQLVIAREYGFASWPKLVRYFSDVHRQSYNYGAVQYHPRDVDENSVRGLLAGHRDRRALAARQLAAYVPRLYGMHADDIFASTVTEDEARLAVARSNGFPSWEVLLDASETEPPSQRYESEIDPMRYVGEAMRAANLDELKRVIETHPDVLHPTDYEVVKGRSVLGAAISHERRRGREVMRPIMDWLVTQGLDLQQELNRQLCGHIRMKTEKVRWLLDRGADPSWVAPNGIPVLEHALIRYWNGEAVDLVAARTVPRKSLWIAAGLGDVEGVSRFLDRYGKPTSAARRLRPDFDAVGQRGMVSHPDPDDEEILMEAFAIAAYNGRTVVLEYMVSRGFSVDSLVWGSPIVSLAVGNAWTPVVECLVRCGANLDLTGVGPGTLRSARHMARSNFENAPQHADYQRIVALCGMDPDAILAERDAREVKPVLDTKLKEVLQLAADDAFRLGQSEIGPENLLFGLMRGGMTQLFTRRMSLQDLERFYADQGNRLRANQDRGVRPRLALNAEAQATMQMAFALAVERRSDWVDMYYLMHAVTRAGGGAVDGLLSRYGSSAATLNAELERAL